MKPMTDYPRETWKKYRVLYSSYGFDCGYFKPVEAPNKTYARIIVKGELNRGHKITRIVEQK